MAGFLRKKATLSRRFSLRDPKTSTSSTPSDRPSADAPPCLPPLILSTSLADPDVDPRAPPALPAAASPPVLSLPTPAPEAPFDDDWNPWKAYTDANPRLDSHAPLTRPPVPPQLPGPFVRPSHGIPSDWHPASNASVDVSNRRDTAPARPSPVATAPSPRQSSARQVQARPQEGHPKSDALGNRPLTQKQASARSPSHARPSTSPPAVVRGQMGTASHFDFEESLSAANVTSVVNQFRSYPLPIRHQASPAPPSQGSQMDIPRPRSSHAHRHHTVPQKPGSSSSHSSSSHHTDATRRTDGSHGSSTSASSVSRAEVIHKDGRLDPPAVDRNPSLPSRPFTSSNRSLRSTTTPSAPPTSYPDRVRPLARQNSHSSLSSSGHPEPHASTPMLYDMLRSGNPDSGPLRRGPLIFAAMSGAQHPVSKASRNASARNPYPSPPTEYASLDPSPSSWRNSTISSVFRGPPQADLRSHEARLVSPTLHSTELPSLVHKSSKSSLRAALERTPSAVSRSETSSDHARPRVLTKARPTTPQKQGTVPCHKVLPEPGDPLLLDDDPFARTEGVKLLRPRNRSSSGASASLCTSREDVSADDAHISAGAPPRTTPEMLPPTPPDDYKTARQQRRGQWLEKAPPPAVAEVVAQLATDEVVEEPREPTPPPTYFPIMSFISDANLLPLLLSYLSYSEWLELYSANKQIRELFQSRTLREFVLERYLGTVGYWKWNYEWAESLPLSLKDLHNYLRGVAMPTHEYARLSAAYLRPPTNASATSDTPDILALALTTRAYNRVVLRLRAQAESEAKYIKIQQTAEATQTTNASRPGTRQHSVSSRAPSPTSSYSRNHSHGKNDRSTRTLPPGVSKFRSPLYRLGRAPVLRVFVPSPEGAWLSDSSVVECEAELKRSGALKSLRVGDVVWDIAVGDEGNLGRLIWDGSYLVDLEYRYSRMGELSPYFHSLAFAPSYFHRVIRIGGSSTHNPHCSPIVYVDISPWGREIAANLQLLQDRARTETPHGALHDVVRWVHRSTFTIRPPVPPSQGQAQSRLRALRIPIPNVEGFYVDPGWYGTVVLESEGTNEGLADLQARCGPGVFPPRAESLATKIRNEKEKENWRVWRILREKSRPGEIWLRAVQVKERIM